MIKQDQGFSLLEVIITLSIVSSCVFLFSLAISQVGSARSLIRDDRQIEWHLFVNQLAYELSESTDVNSTREKLSFKKLSETDQSLENITYERYYRQIRRQVGAKGHQPILLEVTSINFSITDETLEIRVVFTNGEMYHTKLHINEKGRASE